ncbi:hypothetical protein ACFSC4_26100 [Deinococcus malanensis]
MEQTYLSGFPIGGHVRVLGLICNVVDSSRERAGRRWRPRTMVSASTT